MSIIAEFDPAQAIDRSIGLLHPKAALAFSRLSENMQSAHETGRTQYLFKLYEGFRHPSRQKRLIAKRTTKAGPWQSAHQYGLACDFVPVRPGTAWQWTWEVPGADWKLLHEEAAKLGLKAPISWDLAHIQHPLWDRIRHLVV